MAYTNFTNCTEQEYLDIIYSQDDKNRIRIWFNNVELEDAGEYCESLSGTNRILPDDGKKAFSLGNFISKEYDLILRDLPQNTVIQDQVKISIGTLVDENNNTYEDVPLGVFNIQDTPTTDKNKITIKLRDNRVKFDFPYNAKPLMDAHGGSATYFQILEDICTQAGVTNNVGHFSGEELKIGVYDNTIKATNYVAYIAEQCGMIPQIDRNGALIFVDLLSEEQTLTNIKSATLTNVSRTSVDNLILTGETTQETTTGKNLLGLTNVSSTTTYGITYSVNNNVITLSGTANNTSGQTAVLIDIPLINIIPSSSGTLTKSLNGSGTYTGVQTSLRQQNTASAGLWSNDGSTTTGTLSANAYYFRIQINNNVSVNCTLKAQVETGSSATTFERYTYGVSPNPNYPQEVVNVTGRQEIKTIGRNLIKPSATSGVRNGVTFTVNDDNSITMNGTATAEFNLSVTYPMELDNTKQYTISGCTGGSNSTYMLRVVTTQWGDNHFNYDGGTTFTPRDNTKYNIYIFIRNGTTINNVTIKPQLEYGTLTTYEPYQEQINEINLGKNLLNATAGSTTEENLIVTKNSDGSYTLNGTSKSSTWFYRLADNFTLPAGTYTLSNSNSNVGDNTAIFYDDNYNFDRYNISTKTFSTTKTIKPYIRVAANATFNNFIIKPMIEKGSQATTYSPYFTPIELCKLGSNEDKIFKTTGKNLFNKENINLIADSYVDSTGNIVYGANNKFNWVKLEPSTTYTLSQPITSNVNIRVGLFSTTPARNVTGTILGTFSNGNPIVQTFTTTSTNIYLGWVYCNTGSLNNHTEQQMLDSIMIEKSSSATEYEPYGSGEWYKKEAICKVVLDGSETWNVWHYDATNVERFYTNLSDDKKVNPYGMDRSLSNKFICINSSVDTEHFAWSTSQGIYKQIIIYINKSRLSSVDVACFKFNCTTFIYNSL